MIDRNAVRDFFDRLAPSWDSRMIRDDWKINTILDNAGVRKGSRILDVACGTGVLIPDYLEREVDSITAVDLSPRMIHIASQKFCRSNIHFLCADAETADMGCDFDAIVLYNAFPHFSNPDNLIAHLSSLLAPNGILTVAHGMSREEIDGHHSGSASKVSAGLMAAESLAGIFQQYLNVTTIISDEHMYQVAGQRL